MKAASADPTEGVQSADGELLQCRGICGEEIFP